MRQRPTTTIESPNHGERPIGVDPSLVVIHYTGMKTGDAAIERLCDPKAQVSAHVLIDEEGGLVNLVPYHRRAWHAGESAWGEANDVNDISIGIELVNPGHEFGYRAFPERQIDRLIDTLRDIKSRFHIPRAGYVGHSDVAPERKSDPGEKFPWFRLAGAGFGIWPSGDPEFLDQTSDRLYPEELVVLEAQLAAIGYSFDPKRTSVAGRRKALPKGKAQDGNYLAHTVVAFQRHWRQAFVTGQLDRGTKKCIEAVARLADPPKAHAEAEESTDGDAHTKPS